MALLIIFMINLCSANEDWINQQNRVFIEDRIQYWGTGIDTQEDIALFKAKGMALKSIGEEILSHIKSFTKENDKKLLALDKRLTDLEVRPPQQINQTIIKQTYQMTPSQTSYKECMDEYYDLLDEAHRESLNNEGMHKGNLAYGNARNLSNKAMRKEWKCKEYQK